MSTAHARRSEVDGVRELAYGLTGIKLNDGRLGGVVDKINRRPAAIAAGSLDAYLQRVSGGDATERQAFINLITVNKTDFFREAHHFAYLRSVVAREAIERAAQGGPRRLRIWCSAASTGEEPYSIAMALADLLPAAKGWDVKIVATDIDTDVLAFGARGRYALERVAGVPHGGRRFLRREGTEAVISPELQQRIEFRQLNLLGEWPATERFVVIFCRNVVIYFDRDTQRKLFARFAEVLDPHGFLFVGHSESLLGICDRFEPVGQTVHRLVGRGVRAAPTAPAPAVAPVVVATRAPTPPPKKSPPSGRGASLKEVRADPTPHERIVVGGMVASRNPTLVSTVLGSCVSACLYDPVAGVGGMNHFLLPSSEGDPSTPARYGVHAMEQLINEIMRLGGDRRRLQAKLFGASSVIKSTMINVPKKNATFARAFLEAEGISLVHERLEGTFPLEVYFYTSSGRVLVRALKSASNILAPEIIAPSPQAVESDAEVWV